MDLRPWWYRWVAPVGKAVVLVVAVLLVAVAVAAAVHIGDEWHDWRFGEHRR